MAKKVVCEKYFFISNFQEVKLLILADRSTKNSGFIFAWNQMIRNKTKKVADATFLYLETRND